MKSMVWQRIRHDLMTEQQQMKIKIIAIFSALIFLDHVAKFQFPMTIGPDYVTL